MVLLYVTINIYNHINQGISSKAQSLELMEEELKQSSSKTQSLELMEKELKQSSSKTVTRADGRKN